MKRTTAVLACSIGMIFVFAGLPVRAEGPVSPRQISFEELRARCLTPELFDVQRAPQNIRIQCAQTFTEWEPLSAGVLSLNRTKTVTNAVVADKFFFSAQPQELLAPASTGACQKFKEVSKHLAVERALTCDELVNAQGGLDALCAVAIDDAIGRNPQMIESTDTGKLVDTCPASTFTVAK